VASLQMLCQVKVEDGRFDMTGCVGSFYHKITVFSVLDHKNNLVF
jgi:hypothetical protein